MQVNVDPASWLNLVDLLNYNNTIFWESTDYPEIPYSDTDTYVTLNLIYSKRIDLLAWDLYGNPNYFWVILLANNLDYPSDLYEGLTIRVPSKDVVDSLLQPAA